MNRYSIGHKVATRWTPTTHAACALVRSTPTQKQSPLDLIPSTWMKTRKRCFKNVGLDSQTPREKKLKERHARSNLRRPV